MATIVVPEGMRSGTRSKIKDQLALSSKNHISVKEISYSALGFDRIGYTLFNDAQKKDTNMYVVFTNNQYSKILLIKTDTGDIYLGPDEANLTSFFANVSKRVFYTEILLQKKDYYNESVLSLSRKILAHEFDFEELINKKDVEEVNSNELFSRVFVTDSGINGNVFSSLFKSQVVNYIDDLCDTLDFPSVALNVRIMDDRDKTVFAKTMYVEDIASVKTGYDALFFRRSNPILTLGVKDGSFAKKYNMKKNKEYYLHITTQCRMR